MSRNWYIQTDQRRIQDTFGDINVPPPTFREKWQAHRGKYVLRGVGIAAAILLLALALPQIFRRDTADYTVTLVTEQPVGEAGIQALSDAFAALADDRDQNGRVEVAVRTLTVGGDTGEARVQRSLLISSFTTDEYTLFAMESRSYARYIETYAATDTKLFVPLSDDGGQTELWSPENLPRSLPASMVFGVRALKQDTPEQQAHLTLLRALMRQGFPNTSFDNSGQNDILTTVIFSPKG